MKQKVRRKDMTEKILTKSLLLTLLIGISTYPISARALDCTATPDCATLGYTLSAADCTDKPTVKCPTDTSKVFCKKGPDVACAYATILGDDGLCYETLPDGVNPIGIVFDATNKLAIALTEIKKDSTAGKGGFDIDAWNISDIESCDPGSNNNYDIVKTCGTDGRKNTEAILKHPEITAYEVAKSANMYEAKYCKLDFCKKGHWFVPSMKEYSTVNGTWAGNNIDMINTKLKALSSFGATEVASAMFVTSTQGGKGKIWGRGLNDASGMTYGVSVIGYLRPAIYYGAVQTLNPEAITCGVGSIVYGDGKCYSGVPSSVQPVGIVFDTTNKLAIALKDTGSSMKWSIGYCDVPSLTNCSSSSTISSCGVDGKTNTQNLQSSTCSTFPPAQAVKAYSQGSVCTATFCKQGNWFVPSARDFKTIRNNKEALNTSLTQVGGTVLSGSYWASTEYSQVDAWKMEMSTNTLNFDDKVDTVAKVRPVVKYVLPSLDESGGGI